MTAEALLQSLVQATEDEWQQVREDYRSLACGIPILRYHEPYMRAAIISLLMQVRRSDMKENLEAVVTDLRTTEKPVE